jgi:hypothetical protein
LTKRKIITLPRRQCILPVGKHGTDRHVTARPRGRAPT